MSQAVATALDGKQAGAGKCHTRINSYGMAVCVAKGGCQLALRIGSVNWSCNTFNQCLRYPALSQMDKPAGDIPGSTRSLQKWRQVTQGSRGVA